MNTSTSLVAQAEPLVDEEAKMILDAQENPALFQALYDLWVEPVYQYFYHRTGELASAEDLTSQLFLSAYQALPRYRHTGHFAAWLFTIARNQVREYYRKTGREVPLDAVHHLPSPSNLAAELSQDDEIAHLVQLIRTLPESDQELIRLRYVANLSFSDMAVILDKQQDAVKKSLYRLQDRLHNLLEQNHD